MASGVLGAVTGSERAFVAAFYSAVMLIPCRRSFSVLAGGRGRSCCHTCRLSCLARLVGVAGPEEFDGGAVAMAVE